MMGQVQIEVLTQLIKERFGVVVVFGQGKKMGAAFSILYLHGEAYPIFDKEVLP